MHTTAINSSKSSRYLLIVACLLAVLAGLNYTSSGIIRGGEDDEGSGIGGTGLMPTPTGQSGLGGTGFKPFLGYNAEQGLEIRHSLSATIKPVTDTLGPLPAPEQPVTASVRPALVDVAFRPDASLRSGEIDISEKIQRDIEINALYFERLNEQLNSDDERHIGQQSIASTAAVDTPVEPQATVADTVQLAQLDNSDSANAISSDDTALEIAQEPADSAESLTWNTVARYLANNIAADELNTEESAEDSPKDAARSARPERLQRPEIPPVQRVRPIQRAAILPPRVKPLQL